MYQESCTIKGIIKQKNGRYELVADCPGLSREQIKKIVKLLNGEK